MSTPRNVLIAYSKQQATSEQVWRALMAHNAWYVPAAFPLRNLHTNFSEGMTIFANEIPTADSALILFTDPVAAMHADGAPIGPFMREFAGVRIFQALDNGYGCVRVNPRSPKSEGWYISQDDFPFAKLWATVTDLELALVASAGTVAGLAGSWALSRFLSDWLYGITANDPPHLRGRIAFAPVGRPRRVCHPRHPCGRNRPRRGAALRIRTPANARSRRAL